jgi:beta-lactamase class A
MSVKQYSSLYRVLFNASYLSKEYSQKALEILSKSEFKDGIVDGIPQSMTIAHKFGERHYSTGVDQLHDCGIIYYPYHPYLLCIMTKGTDFKQQSKTIRDISDKIYKEMEKRYKK